MAVSEKRYCSRGSFEVERVAHGEKGVLGGLREAGFQREFIGHVLVVEPGRVHCLLDVELAFGRGEKDVGDGGDDAGASGRAEDKAQTAIFKHDGGRHGA